MDWTVVSLLLLASLAPPVHALDNGVGQTPILGFNSWNIFACNVNETVMMETMELFVTLGLRDAGYKYVNIDDCWAKSRDATTGTRTHTHAHARTDTRAHIHRHAQV